MPGALAVPTWSHPSPMLHVQHDQLRSCGEAIAHICIPAADNPPLCAPLLICISHDAMPQLRWSDSDVVCHVRSCMIWCSFCHIMHQTSLTTTSSLILAVFLLQANQIGHLICACCHMTLMFAHGAQSVKCAVCNHVTPVNMSSVVQPQQQQR